MAHNRVPVVAIDADGNRVKFPSMTAAAKTIGVSIAHIWEAVNFGYPCRGLRWEEDKEEV